LEPEFTCDYLAFKSSFDVDSYIGNEFNFNKFITNDISKYINSSVKSSTAEDIERFMVYIYPDHKSMFSCLENNSFLDFYNNNKIDRTIALPDGGILHIKNQETESLEIELITNNIINKDGN
jgi:hypothetical protein